MDTEPSRVDLVNAQKALAQDQSMKALPPTEKLIKAREAARKTGRKAEDTNEFVI